MELEAGLKEAGLSCWRPLPEEGKGSMEGCGGEGEPETESLVTHVSDKETAGLTLLIQENLKE